VLVVNGKVFTAREGAAPAQAFAVKDGKIIAVARRPRSGPASGRTPRSWMRAGASWGRVSAMGISQRGRRPRHRPDALARRPARGGRQGRGGIDARRTSSSAIPTGTRPSSRSSACHSRPSSTASRPQTPWCWLRGGHDYILNSAALHHWNISKDTPVPEGGAITRRRRDADRRRRR
jgi:hypothetical protein